MKKFTAIALMAIAFVAGALAPVLKPVETQIRNAFAVVATVFVLAMEPIHWYARRYLCLYEGPELKELEVSMKKVFAEMQDNIKKIQDTAAKALEEVRTEGTLHAKTNEKLTELGKTGTDLSANVKELRDRMLDVEQKLAKKPGANPGEDGERKSAGQLFAESDSVSAMIKSKATRCDPVTIERKTISNATGQNQPLVASDRLAGIVMPAMRRMTVRDLIPQLRTTSNLIEYCKELVFTNNAGPQYDGSSPTAKTEGAPKNESNITFELATSAVITLAHWLGASRQVLSDATQLAGYIDTRLEYGLKLEEEDELMNSTGTSGELNGLLNQATAFTGGATNQTILDTLLKAFLQVSLSEYEASGVVLNPIDWTTTQMLKDTQGRYLFSDPQAMTQPRVWGKPVVPTQAITQGTFLTGAFDLAAAIYDREDMNIRVSDQHADFFTKNLVAILCEERLALVVYRPAAIVTGNVSYAG